MAAESAVSINKVPGKAWVVTFAGMTINLCLGILYAWSVWAKALIDVKNAGQPMSGINEGWTYLTNAEAATPFSLCVIIFALFMIPGGRIQDKFGPKVGATRRRPVSGSRLYPRRPDEELFRLDHRLRNLGRHRNGYRLCRPNAGCFEMVWTS